MYTVCLGQHDDARMCIAIAITAARMGASIANYTEVVELIKGASPDGKEILTGAKVRDRLTGFLIAINLFAKGRTILL